METLTVIRKDRFNGKRIYQRRLELGLSLEQVAMLIRRNVASIHGWETGRHRPTPRSLYLLSHALRVKPRYFFAQ